MFLDIYEFIGNMFAGTDGYFDYAVEFLAFAVSAMISVFSVLLVPAVVWILIKFIISCVRL